MATLSGYITNLGKYNEGELVGKWIELPIDEDDFEEELKEIGIGEEDEFGQVYEEYFWTDWECDIPGVTDNLGEYVSLESVNELAEKVESVDDEDAFGAALEMFGDLDEAFEYCNDMQDLGKGMNEDRVIGEHYFDELGRDMDRSTMENYLDYEQIGYDIRLDYYQDSDDDPETAGEYWCGDEDASDEEIGRAFVDAVGFDGLSHPENYFDVEAYGHDIRIEGMFVYYNGHVWECLNY